MEALILYLLGVSVIKFGLAGVVKKKRVISGFVFQVMLGEPLCVSGPSIFHISCGTISHLS